MYSRRNSHYRNRIILLHISCLMILVVRIVKSEKTPGTVNQSRTDREMDEIKRELFKDEVKDNEIEYGNHFEMQYRGKDKDAMKLGKKFGLILERKMFEDFYIFSKPGVPERSKYKFPLSTAAMRNKDKKLVSITQATHVELVGKVETLKRVERNAEPITNEDLETEWYFRKNESMGVFEAWERGYSGKGIIVTVSSDGIQVDHPDLVNNFNESLGYDYLLGIPGGYNVETTDIGGTQAVGLMASVYNDECVTGLSYGATFASVRMYSDNTFVSDYDLALSLTHRLDVVDINYKTWTYLRYGKLYKTFTTLEKSAIEKGIREGRNGKGTIYVTSTMVHRFPEDCNTDPYSKSINTITATAVKTDGSYFSGGEQCTAVLVSAFGWSYDTGTEHMKTTYVDNGCGYTTGPAGASALVASAVALTLEANNELTYRDVQHLIVETASPDIITGLNFTINGAGKKVSPAVGFGLVNVSALVIAAETWNNVPDLISCVGPVQTVDICCEEELTANFTVDACHINFVEHVEVYAHFKAVWREHIELHLISAQGTDNRIMRKRPEDHVTKALEYTFTSVQNWGEDPSGNWTLMMKDFYPCENLMHLYSWSLTIYGTVTDPLLGKPENGTLGGHATPDNPCQDGTYPLKETNICIYCDLAGYRVVNGVCVKDGDPGGYCDDVIKCAEELWCNNSVCKECSPGFHSYSGICIEDGTLGGYCDGNILCDLDPPHLGCNESTLRCVNCTNGWRVITGLCFQDGKVFGYCDENIKCNDVITIGGIQEDIGCVLDVNRCDFCSVYVQHSMVDSVCMPDGILGGVCTPFSPCKEPGLGCNLTTGICVDCSMKGYRTWNTFCMKDGTLNGYCDKDVKCLDDTHCDPVTTTCVICNKPGLRVIHGFCMKDGHLGGYCSDQVHCVTRTDDAACVKSTGICVNCQEPSYIENGFCIVVDETSDENKEAGSDVGMLAGVGAASVVIGVISTFVGFAVLAKRFVMPKIKPVSSQSLVKNVNVGSKGE